MIITVILLCLIVVFVVFEKLNFDLKDPFYILKQANIFFNELCRDDNVFMVEKPRPVLYSYYLNDKGKINKNTIAFGQYFPFKFLNHENDEKKKYLTLIAIRLLEWLKLYYSGRILIENGKRISSNNIVIKFNGFTLFGKYVVNNGGIYTIFLLFLFFLLDKII